MTISRRILIHVAVGVAFVVAVVTAVTYAQVFDALKKSGLRQLDIYTHERAEREEARFLQVQSNLALVRGQFLQRLAKPLPEDVVQERFDRWYRRYEDGAWRSRESFKDARKTSSMWADRDWPATPEMKRGVVIAQELCDEMLPGWVDHFPSYYFQFPAPGLVNVGVDILMADWAWKMPAHFDTTGLEWMALALPQGEVRDVFSWTGLQQDDVGVSNPLVSVYLPVIKDGVFIASVGHNMPMNRLLDAATYSEVPGAAHFILRTDGRLIANPSRRADILASKGQLKAQDCGDPALARLYQIAAAEPGRRFSGYDRQSGHYYSIARLAGPEWYYVTTMSRDYLQRRAFASAQWVLWSGLVSLALALGLIALTLHKQVARPLAELTRATDAMAADVDHPPVLAPRADELGALAESFRNMVQRVAGRERDLRELNAGLEQRVADRTADLHAALERERELGELKTNFVSLVSHEFRTPLGVIMAAVEVLQRYFDRLDEANRHEHLDIIFRSTKNLAGLIEEVLLLGRVEDGAMHLTPVPGDLDKFCRTLADELCSATGGSCPIRYQALTPLESACFDEAALRHILTNLLSNAVKYSAAGQPVEVTAARDGDEAVLTIRDQGIGIPEADQAQLFRSFTRGSNVGNRPGTGLGLVIVQRCVKLHGGSLHLESSPGTGTKATIRLALFPVTAPVKIHPPSPG